MYLAKLTSWSIVFGCLCLLSGCAGKSPRLEQNWQENSNSLAIVVVPPPKSVYLQLETRADRVSPYNISAGLEAAVSLIASGLGSWAGIAYAASASNVPANVLVASNPILFATTAVVLPVAQVTSRLVRRRQATAKVAPFREILDSHEQNLALNTIKRHLHSRFANSPNLNELRLSIHELEAEKPNKQLESLLPELQADHVLVVSFVPVFSPQFDTLEMYLGYALLNTATDLEVASVEASYANVLIVQSTPLGGLDGSNTTNELPRMAQFVMEQELEKVDQNKRLSKFERTVERNQHIIDKDKNLKKWRRAYYGFDTRSEDGAVWMENNANHFLAQLESISLEAARTLVADLERDHSEHASFNVAPPSYSQLMNLNTHLGSEQRDVYQTKKGTLVSIEKTARMIPLGKGFH